MRRQRTLGRAVVIEGIGLHSGAYNVVRLLPAPPGSGIVFIRTDLANGTAGPTIPARIGYLTNTPFSTVLGDGKTVVRTVEHLLSALYAAGIDNAEIETDGEEIPIKDGSTLPFIEAIDRAGIVEQDAEQPYLQIVRPFEYAEGERRVWAEPLPSHAPYLSISYRIAFKMGRPPEEFSFRFSTGAYRRQIAPARTFGFARDIDSLRRQGLIRGGSLQNAVVIGEDGVLNPEGLRFSNECVRHKILDLIGDLSLAGMPVLGKFFADGAGHRFHTSFVAALLADRGAWRIIGRRTLLPAEPAPLEALRAGS